MTKKDIYVPGITGEDMWIPVDHGNIGLDRIYGLPSMYRVVTEEEYRKIIDASEDLPIHIEILAKEKERYNPNPNKDITDDDQYCFVPKGNKFIQIDPWDNKSLRAFNKAIGVE